MIDVIKADLRRYKQQSTLLGLINGLRIEGFRFVYIKRKCEASSVKSLSGFFYRFYYKHLQVKFGYQIPHTCKIGKGFYIGHFGNVVINQEAVIGENCNVAQGVTIGHVSRGKKRGSPRIGNRVWIGANSVIVGNIRIGNDVMIAPLTFVNFDVPDGALVIGSPGKVVGWSGSAGYINNI